MADCVHEAEGDTWPPKKPLRRKHDRASLTYRSAGQVNARTLLVDLRSAGNEKTWTSLLAKFRPEDHATVSAAAAAVLASATDGKKESTPPWRLAEYACQMLFDIFLSLIHI